MKIKKSTYDTPIASWCMDIKIGKLSIRKYSFLPLMVWWNNKGTLGGALPNKK